MDCSCAASPVLILVDDEATFRLALAELLRSDGHTVLDYASPATLLAFENIPKDALLVTDFEMPGQNGVELADTFRRARPTSRVMLVSGYSDGAIDPAIAARPWLRFMPKPVDYNELHAMIHAEVELSGSPDTGTRLVR